MSEIDIDESRKKVIHWLKYHYRPVMPVKSVQSNLNKILKSKSAENKTPDKMGKSPTQGCTSNLKLKTKQTKPKIKKPIQETENFVLRIPEQKKTHQVNWKIQYVR